MSGAGHKQHLVSGAAWSIGMRWAVRLLGLLNTVIMARLLAPEDYGVVAMSMLVVGLIQSFLDMGTETALLRKDAVTRDEIDSGWTLKLLQSVAVGVVIALAGWPAALYFEEPRVTAMCWALGACIALAGLQNFGLVVAQKQLDFRLQFRHAVASKAVSVAATLAAGWWLGDWRALLVGLAAGYVGSTVLSYLMHPYRPRWTLVEARGLWATSKWLMLGNMGGYLVGKVDELTAARVGSTHGYGLYNVGTDLGGMPIVSIGPAIVQSLLPVLAKIEHDVERTRQAVIKTIAALNTVTLPLGLGFAALAVPATVVVLGEKWREAAVFVALFSVAAALRLMLNPLRSLLVLRGHARITTHVIWAELAGFVLAALLLVPAWSLVGLALARIVGECAHAGLIALAARRHCGVALRSLVRALLRPATGALLMSLLVGLTVHQTDLPLLQLLAGAAVGGAFFTAWTFGTWRLAGRPDGLETTLLEQWRRWRPT